MSRQAADWLELPTSGGRTIKVLKAMHPRARRLRLTVTPSGARLSYPCGTHPAKVFAFLRDHGEWLERKLEQLNVHGKTPPRLKPGIPTLMPLHGKSLRLTWAEASHPKVCESDDTLCLQLPQPWSCAMPVARNLLTDYLETTIRRDLAHWMPGYVAQLGRAPTAIHIRPLKSLWGSLDSRDRINMDMAMAMAPRAALRYVFVHELCHLRVRNHSTHFWHKVEQLMPDYQVQRDWLRVNGGMLKTEIERLAIEV